MTHLEVHLTQGLGTFDTAQEAQQARLHAERELHGVQPRRAHLHG